MQTTVDKGTYSVLQTETALTARNPTATVKIDWDNDGTYEANTDISSYVAAISGRRELQEDDPSILVKGYVAADCDIELKDAKNFAKDIATSPRHDAEIIMLPVRVSAGFGGNEVRIHEGYIKKLDLGSASREANIYCYDRSIELKGYTASTPIYVDAASDGLIDILLRIAGVYNRHALDTTTNLLIPGTGGSGAYIGEEEAGISLEVGMPQPQAGTTSWNTGISFQDTQSTVDGQPGSYECLIYSYAITTDCKVGCLEFDITPDWDGDDNTRHQILNFSQGLLTSGFAIFKDTDNLLYMRFQNDAAKDISHDISDWIAGETHYVACNYTTVHSDATGSAELFIDGISVGTLTNVAIDDINTYTHLILGSNNRYAAWNYPTMATISEVRQSSALRTQDEITAAQARTQSIFLADGQNVVQYAWFADSDIWDEIGNIAEAEQGRVFFDEVGNFHFINRYSLIQDSDSATSVATLAYNTNTQDIQLVEDVENIYNHISIDLNQKVKAGSATTLWTYADAGKAASEIPAYTTRYITGYANSPCENQDYIAPVGTTDYTVNTAADGSGEDITGGSTIAGVKGYGDMLVARVSNVGPVTGFITKLEVRGKAISDADTEVITSEDTTSQTRYGKRVLPVSNKYITDAGRAQILADYYITKYKDPTIRISGLDCKAIPYLQLADRVTVDDSGYLNISGDYWVKAINYNIGDGYTMSLDLVACDSALWGLYDIGKYDISRFVY